MPSISYAPIWDAKRHMVAVTEKWDIKGTLVNFPTLSQTLMSAKIAELLSFFSQEYVDLVMLEDSESRAPTSMALYANQCMNGPYIIDAGLPTGDRTVFESNMPYRVSYEARRMLSGVNNPVLSFRETLAIEPGGEHRVAVGGAINIAEIQTSYQNKHWEYVQSGSSIGLFSWLEPPPAIYPWAMASRPKIVRNNPKIISEKGIHSEFETTWEYRMISPVELPYPYPHKYWEA